MGSSGHFFGSGPRPKLLFIDPFCPTGHLGLNRVLVAGLREAGYDVSTVLRPGYWRRLALGGPGPLLEPADELFAENVGPIRARWNQWRLLRQVRGQLQLADYAVIFFSSYDELATVLAGPWRNAVFLNHANIAGMDWRLKAWAMRRLGAKGRMLVFHEHIADRGRSRGLPRVEVFPQGLPPPHARPAGTEQLGDLDVRFRRGHRHTIFVPAGAKYEDGFIRAVTEDPAFREFLRSRDILWVVKAAWRCAPDDRIVVLDRFLTTAQYEALFGASAGLVLHYPASFNFRVSATLMECFSNAKPCTASNIESFRVFAPHFAYDPFYRSKEELMAKLDTMLAYAATGRRPYQDLQRLQPRFETARAWAETPAA